MDLNLRLFSGLVPFLFQSSPWLSASGFVGWMEMVKGGFLYPFAQVCLFTLYCIKYFIGFVVVDIYPFDIICVKQK